MNKPLIQPVINLTLFEPMLIYINNCCENNYYSDQDLFFEVDGILYSVRVQKSKPEKIDLESNSRDLLGLFPEAVEYISKEGKVSFKFGSTDRYKSYVTISTNQGIDLVRQSIASLAQAIL